MIRHSKIFLFFLITGLLAACGRSSDIHWRDGNYIVYAMDSNFSKTKLGFDHKPGILGLIDSTVIAIGSNAHYILAKRLNEVTSNVEFYIITNSIQSNAEEGSIDGPYSEDQLKEKRSELVHRS